MDSYDAWLVDFRRRLALHDAGVAALARDLALRTKWTVHAMGSEEFAAPPPTAGQPPDVLCERGSTRPLCFEVELPETLVRRTTVDRLRAITSLVQPFLFLFVLGTGLSRLASRGLPAGVDFRTFIYPGVLAMSVLFTSIFSAASIVWDREFGFLREMMVAPIRRSSIVIGKVFGGATVASLQGKILMRPLRTFVADVNMRTFLALRSTSKSTTLARTSRSGLW